MLVVGLRPIFEQLHINAVRRPLRLSRGTGQWNLWQMP